MNRTIRIVLTVFGALAQEESANITKQRAIILI